MRQEQFAVSGADLLKMFTSRRFRSDLADAGRITLRTGHEAGFAYYHHVENRCDYSTPVFEGLTNILPNSFYNNWLWDTFGDPTVANDLVQLLDLHFHPTTTEAPLFLSEGDVRGVDGATTVFHGRPIVAVAQVSDGGLGYAALLQRATSAPVAQPSTGVAEQFVDEYYDHRYEPAEDWMAACCDNSGVIRGDILRFRIPSERGPARILNPSVLERFGFGSRVPDHSAAAPH